MLPLSGSTAMGSFRHLSQPAPGGHVTRRPVLSIARSSPQRASVRKSSRSVRPRRESVVWSRTGNATPRRAKMEAIRPSTCRSARRKTARTISMAAIAASEKVRRPAGARQLAPASGETQTVMSPRRASPRS
jgi:hypothetical protein